MQSYRMMIRTVLAALTIGTAVAGCAANSPDSQTGGQATAQAAGSSGLSAATTQYIAYVAAVPLSDGKKQFRLMISDIYGAGQRTITTTREPIMSPAWSPDMKQLAYSAFDHGHSAIYSQTLATGSLQRLVSLPGINSAPAWSPDGRYIAFAGSDESRNCDIYLYDNETHQTRRLTNNPAIDTEPAWAPDGKSLVFMSDRTGHPQIYSTDIVGGTETLIPAASNSQSPKYSPDGKSLAFVTQSEKGLQIALLNLATHAVQTLTSGTVDDEPSFSPDGSSIMYLSQPNPPKGDIAIVGIDGTLRRVVPNSLDIKAVAWSPK